MSSWEIIGNQMSEFDLKNSYVMVNLLKTRFPHINLDDIEKTMKATDNKLYLCIGDNFSAFDNSCTKELFKIKLDSSLRCFCISSCKRYIIICLDNGNLILFDNINGVIINSVNTIPNIVSCYLDNCNDGICAIVIDNFGKCLQIQFTNESSEINEIFHLRKCINSICKVLNNIIISFETNLYVYDLDNNVSYCTDVFQKFTKLYYMDFFLLGLTNEGDIIHIFTDTFTTCNRYRGTYLDINVIDDDESLEYLYLLKGSDDGTICMEIRKLHDFQQIFSINVEQSVAIIPSKTLFTYIIQDETTGESVITRVKKVTPYVIYKDYIKMKQYDKAEAIAKEYNLDYELLALAKIDDIVIREHLSCLDVNNFLVLFDVIQDKVEYKLKTLMDMIKKDHEDLDNLRLLFNASNGIIKSIVDVPTRQIKFFINELNCLNYKFNIFISLLHKSIYKLEEWTEFFKKDLLEELISHLRKNNVTAATIISTQLNTDHIKRITPDMLRDILKLINFVHLNTKLFYTLSFLIITYFPNLLPEFADFYSNVIKEAEEKSKSFIKDMSSTTKHLIKFTWKMDNDLTNNFLTTLNKIDKILDDIKDINTKLNIIVKFEDVLMDTGKLIRDLIRNRNVANKLLIDYVNEYITRNSLDVNTIFIDEITLLINDDSVDKILIMLNYLTDMEARCDIIVNLLMYVFPWTDEIKKLALSYRKYSIEIENYIKMEDVFYVFHKYGFQDIIDIYDKRSVLFATNRILYCNKSNMLDDIYKLCICDTFKRDVIIVIANYFFNNDKQLELLKWLKSIPNADAEVVCESIFRMYRISTFYVEEEYGNVNIMKPVCEIYRKICSSDPRYYINEYEKLKNFKLIDDTFNLTININDLDDNITRENLCNDLILCMVNDFDLNSKTIVNYSNMIGDTLSYNKSGVLVKYCEIVNNSEIIRKLIEYMCEMDNFEYVYEMVLVLIKKTLENSHEEGTLLDFSISAQTNDNVDELNINLKTIQYYITKAWLSSDCDLLKLSELAIWLSPLQYHIPRKSNYPASSQYLHKTRPITVHSFNLFREILFRCVAFKKQCYQRSTNISTNHFKRELDELHYGILNICDSGHELLAYNLMRNVEMQLTSLPNLNDNLSEYINANFTKPVVNILSKRILETDNDEYEFLGALIIKNCSNIWQFLHKNMKIYKKHYQKFKYLVNLGLRLNLNEKERSFCEYLLLTCKWWEKYRNSKCKHYTELHVLQPMKILDYFLDNNLINTSELEEFATDFKLCLQNCLMINLQKIITNCVLEYEIIDMAFDKVLLIKYGEEELYEKCIYIVNKIEDKMTVMQILIELYKTINCYYYEVYLCILRIMNMLEPSQVLINKETLLRFLMKYRRISEPSTTEYSGNLEGMHGLLQFRIPYVEKLFSTKVFDFVKREINLDTYKIWFEVLPILNNLSIDDLCIEALRNIKLPEERVNLSLERHERLAKQIKCCINYATNKEPAVTVLYHLVQKTSNSDIKCYLAELCFEYISDYRKEEGSNLELNELNDVKSKITKLYKTCKITSILTNYGLNENNYSDKINNPYALIMNLYGDERITKCNSNLIPDLNKCAEEIANFAKLDINKIRMHLVDELLQSENEITLKKNVNITRLLYVFKSGNLATWQKYLLDAYKSPKNDSFHKAKLLECLSLISTDEYLVTNTGRNLIDLKKHINKLIISNKLTYHGFSINSTDELDTYKKSKIFLVLNSSKSFHPDRLMVLLCLTYEIYERKYWKAIFKLAINLQAWENLLYYLQLITLKINFHDDDFYLNAWQVTLENWFDWQSDDNLDLFLDYTLLIQMCPVVAKLNFPNIMDKLCSQKCYIHVTWLLNYCDEDKQKYYSQIVLRNVKDIMLRLQHDIKDKCFDNIDTIKNILKKYQLT